MPDSLVVVIYIICGLAIVATFAVIFRVVKKHKDFAKKSASVMVGMTKEDVSAIMGCPATCTEVNGNQVTVTWEKRQWMGIFRGGTLTRAVKVVFLDNRVLSVSSKNLKHSAF